MEIANITLAIVHWDIPLVFQESRGSHPVIVAHQCQQIH
ncbi:hypothetical protein NIES4101_66160 [Calothrix sp. NIES-4101]|nr:hypothetical protein NIES4101_66160 [Calothrix sp. NIES-4101]